MTMSKRSEDLLRAGILIATGVFLYGKISSGTLFFYIHPRFSWLTLLAATLFVLLGAVTFQDLTARARPASSDQEHAHSHTRSHAGSRWALALVALPLLLGTLVPPRPLGAQSLGSREVSVSELAPARQGQRTELLDPALGDSVLGWLTRFGGDPDPAAFTGQEADVIGFVYRDERFGGDELMVARFAVYCCVADAVAVGLIVRWPEAAALEADQWVRVQGRFEPGEFDGERIPILVADSVTATEPPSQPYVYP
jgi:uncharacterized repeat protein (TIGR03943 family)